MESERDWKCKQDPPVQEREQPRGAATGADVEFDVNNNYNIVCFCLGLALEAPWRSENCVCCSSFPLTPGSEPFTAPPSLSGALLPPSHSQGSLALLGAGARWERGRGSQSVCKCHCFDTEASGTVRNSKKQAQSSCCQGRAGSSQACTAPASLASAGIRARHHCSGSSR